MFFFTSQLGALLLGYFTYIVINDKNCDVKYRLMYHA